jgi:hypothetical protein
MVLKTMKGFKLPPFIILISILFSCEENGWFTNCSDCLTTEPERANLIIKLSETDIQAVVNIYEGELEDSILYHSTMPMSSIYNLIVGLNKKYTATATYYIEGNTYTAVDSATPKVRFTETQCKEACYFVYDREIDLRLKYFSKRN